MASCSQSGTAPLGTTREAVVTTFGPTLQERGYMACVQVPGGRTVMVGGNDSGGNDISAVEIFDGKAWKAAGSTVEAREHVAAVWLESKARVLVHGGNKLSSAELYDPATQTSKATTPSSKVRSNHALMPISGGRAIAIGGSGDGGAESSTEIYDPATEKWTAGPSMSIVRAWPTAVRLNDGRVLVVDNAASPTAEVLSADGSRFTVTMPMKAPRAHPGLGVLGDGTVLAVGGSDAGGTDMTSSEIWNPSTNAWTTGPTSVTARYQPRVVSLASGSALVLGGTGVGNDMERFDPGAAAFVNLGILAERHAEGACSGTIPGGGFIAAGNYATIVTEGWIGAAGSAPCKVNGDCASGSCASGTCTAPVTTDAGPPPSPDASPSTPPPVSETFARCTKSSDCPSGHCIDGICCDTACDSLCHSCVLPGTVGKCTPEPPGVDLRAECGVASTCSATCDGAGKCMGASAGTQCAPSKCVSASTGVGPTLCVAAGAKCPAEGAQAFDCSPYACEPVFGACRASCASSSDCAGGFVCDVDAKTCVAPAPPESSSGCAVVGSNDARVSHVEAWLVAFGLALSALGRRRKR